MSFTMSLHLSYLAFFNSASVGSGSEEHPESASTRASEAIDTDFIPESYDQDRQDRHHLLGDNLGDVGGLTPHSFISRRCARWDTRGGANAFEPNFYPIPIDAGGVR